MPHAPAAPSDDSNSPDSTSHPIFDAHLDLAYLGACGRDMLRAGHAHLAAGEPGCGPDAPGCLTLPTLQRSPVKACLGTIFLEPAGTDPRASYAPGDASQACGVALAQLRCYQAWQRAGAITLCKQHALRCNVHPLSASQALPPLHIGLLLEGADCLREPADIAWWHAQGVVAVGLSWAHHSRYATGNNDARQGGLTPLGKALVPMLDALAIVHDASHLSDASLDDLLSLTSARVVATHSNCRELLPSKAGLPNQRHLSKSQIRAIASRDGVIGLNLFEPFLLPPGASPRATISHAVRHVMHVCEVAGHARCVGLGSDMDGGFSRARLPQGLDEPALLPNLLDALRTRGMPEADLRNFAHANWERVFASSLAANKAGDQNGDTGVLPVPSAPTPPTNPTAPAAQR